MINVCDRINCPFANVHPTGGRSSGCTRYSVSNHCHLLQVFSNLQPNQYWLHADQGMVDLFNIKTANDTFVAQDERSQQQLEFEREVDED